MKKILILENGKAISNMINNLFEIENYKILSSENFPVKTGLPKQIPDLVIADLTSIKKEKVELLMQLKSNPVISLVPFLLITSENGIGSEEQFSVLNYYLNKPFTKESLYLLIKKILNHTDSLSPW